MTRHQEILWEFRKHGNKMTLGEMLTYPWGYKSTSRMSELRKTGYHFVCEKGKTASENTYRLLEFDKAGQGQLIQTGGWNS